MAKGFLGQDWSWSNFANKGKGLLTDRDQQMALQQNPMFQMGMGLLSENRQPFGGDPFAGVMGGLSRAQQAKESAEDRQRKEEQRKKLDEWFKQQSGQINMPTPTEQALQMSLNPNMPGSSAPQQLALQQQAMGMQPQQPFAAQTPIPGRTQAAHDFTRDPAIQRMKWEMLLNQWGYGGGNP